MATLLLFGPHTHVPRGQVFGAANALQQGGIQFPVGGYVRGGGNPTGGEVHQMGGVAVGIGPVIGDQGVLLEGEAVPAALHAAQASADRVQQGGLTPAWRPFQDVYTAVGVAPQRVGHRRKNPVPVFFFQVGQ